MQSQKQASPTGAVTHVRMHTISLIIFTRPALALKDDGGSGKDSAHFTTAIDTEEYLGVNEVNAHAEFVCCFTLGALEFVSHVSTFCAGGSVRYS